MSEWGPLFDDALRKTAARTVADWLGLDPEVEVTPARDASIPFYTAWVQLEGLTGITLVLFCPEETVRKSTAGKPEGLESGAALSGRESVAGMARNLSVHISKLFGVAAKPGMTLVSLTPSETVFLPTSRKLADAAFRIGEESIRFVLIESGCWDPEDDAISKSRMACRTWRKVGRSLEGE